MSIVKARLYNKTRARVRVDPILGPVLESAIAAFALNALNDDEASYKSAIESVRTDSPRFGDLYFSSGTVVKKAGGVAEVRARYEENILTGSASRAADWVYRGSATSGRQLPIYLSASGVKLTAGQAAVEDSKTGQWRVGVEDQAITDFQVKTRAVGAGLLSVVEAAVNSANSGTLFGCSANTLVYRGASFYTWKKNGSLHWLFYHQWQHNPAGWTAWYVDSSDDVQSRNEFTQAALSETIVGELAQ